MRKLLITTALLLACGAVPAHAQSFNCNYAKTADEVAICQYPKLADMDIKLANLYFGYRNLSYGRDRQKLEATESFWLQYRHSCGRDAPCIARAYQDQVNLLYRHFTPEVCHGAILRQPNGCDPGGRSEIYDEDVANVYGNQE
jgi:uncharacterized protein